ncbi:hypothetical protein [Bdellovibrio bacteriovorus]|uniref:hypothetical protein n=1 Tax=Bdellovibrio bacteriovorus TaxID=959 RepID=UPI0035A92670
MKNFIFAITFTFLVLQSSSALATMKFIYHPPESNLDTRYNFHWEVLRAILDATAKKHGPYEMNPSVFMTEDRQLSEIQRNKPHLTVMIRETNRNIEKSLLPVRIPIDRNLIGYRVFLIKKNKQKDFDKMSSLGDLRKVTLGQGKGWGDIPILENAGFKVLTEIYYDDLFKSLNKEKYQAFPRGITEVHDEIETFKKIYPQLTVEKKFLLYYPLPTYFWFPNSEEGRLMALRVEEGFKTIIKNGTYQNLFDKYYSSRIMELNLKKRQIITIENPQLPETVPFKDKELWYEPVGDR